MNSIKNVPARVLSRRPGHSLEAEREQFDKTQASGGAAGGRRRLPFPSHASLGARPAPASRAPGARAAPRTPCSPATWGSPASSRPRPPGSPAFAARAAPRAGEPEARAGARARGGGGPGWPGTGMQPGTEMRPGDQVARRPRCPGTERRPGTEVARSRGGGRGPGGGSRDAAGGQVGSRRDSGHVLPYHLLLLMCHLQSPGEGWQCPPVSLILVDGRIPPGAPAEE
ncbi:hypothetical protein J1605_012739 [Eschrichtius robustus]|uniref:Uncharacterized protein n=1 Tax=Eschrichtius robustus TaxID=9764 RepID=A0AB34GJ43_ESCRO|nr:hypothetical protein J1605_012739 [Eschrichtius robustus]